jgi:ribosomal protein S21
MALTVRRKDNEPLSSFLYRVTRKIQQSGVLLEARKRRFRQDAPSKNSRQRSRLNRLRMQKEIQKFLKQGFTVEEAVDRARKVLKDIIKK